MVKLEATTDLSTDEVVELVSKHFAERSLGLAVKSKGKDSICLVNADGSVTLTACRFGRRTKLEIDTIRFEDSVKNLLKSL